MASAVDVLRADGVGGLAEFVEFLNFIGSPGAMKEGGVEEEEVSDLEPLFFDEVDAVADHQRRLLREEEAARQRQIFQDRLDCVMDYDPKHGGRYSTRSGFGDLATSDPMEESPLGPMRNTDRKDDAEFVLYTGINVLSLKITSLDFVKFPIHVYGTVVVRDSLDRNCVYIFRRDEDQCQVINSKSESLLLTGPKRGLVLIDDTFIEIHLKIKGAQWQRDLSRGFVTVRSMRTLKNVVESESLGSKLSTVEVMYAVVKHAVEATIAVKVKKGNFNGKITACTTSIRDSMLLHDSKLAGTGGGCCEGTIQLLRSVVTVDIKDMLIISFKASDGKFERTIDFTPRANRWEQDVITVGATKMGVKVTWSAID